MYSINYSPFIWVFVVMNNLDLSKVAVFDIEADDLLDTATKIHCLVVQPADGKEEPREVPVEDFINDVYGGVYDTLVGHNIVGYDIPLLEKLHNFRRPSLFYDTLLLSRLIYTNIFELDLKSKKIKEGKLGGHDLASWGQRFGLPKLPYDDFKTYCPEMLEYCKRDVEITSKLFRLLHSKNYSEEAIKLEHPFAEIICRQMEYGFAFDVDKAQRLYLDMRDRQKEIENRLKRSFIGWYKDLGEFVPKRKDRKKGYDKGSRFNKIEWVDFNPGSREQIVEALKRKYGWSPKIYTDKGNPKMDETVIESLDFPEAKDLKDYLTLEKRMSAIADGKTAWLKLEKNGRLYGNVQTNGAVTGRCTHSNPNLANVTASYSEYGPECRSLFYAPNGRYLVGCDASGLELRGLAHYLYPYDGGEFAKVVVEGDKDKGTDAHSLNAKVLGCDRDTAKTWIYAFIYGAQDKKLGSILGVSKQESEILRNNFLEKFSALSDLLAQINEQYSTYGYLVGLDGRKLNIRSRHSLLNMLIQSAGAILMKKALVICDETLQKEKRLEPKGIDYEFVVNVHDEWQAECSNLLIAENVGKVSVEAIEKAGEYFNFKCPVTGEYKIGKTWAETH